MGNGFIHPFPRYIIMKRILVNFCLSLLCCLSMVAQTRYVKTNLNLRYGPGTSYEVITVLPKGTTVTIEDDCDCKWVPVRYGKYIGYLRTSYLSKHHITQSVHRAKNSVGLSHKRYYTNSYGNRVQSPTYYNRRPAGATALCRDGTYSFSQSRRGTCSHHGGVAQWY